MTNKEKVLALIRAEPGLTDAQIVERTGITPHQQVNQICNAFREEGLIRREGARRATSSIYRTMKIVMYENAKEKP